jgi:hypothetical protein
LTATASDLLFAALDRWTVELISDDPGFDGDNIYVELMFNPSTAGGPVVEDLATTLLVGNITGGRDIEVTDGDVIKGQDAPAASGLDGKDLILQPGLGDGAGADGAVVVPGKLTVTGVIDPKAIIFDEDDSSAMGSGPAAGQGAIFVADSGAGQPNTPYYTGPSFSPFMPMIGGNVVLGTIGGPTFSAFPRGRRMYSPAIGGGGSLTLTLPPADEMLGRVIYLQHRGDGTGTFTLSPDGADTIEGLVSSYDIPYGSTVAFICDGVSNWTCIKRRITSHITKDVPKVAGGTVLLKGFIPEDGVIIGVNVMMVTLNTVGAYDFTFVAGPPGGTLAILDSAPFSMNTISSATTPEPVPMVTGGTVGNRTVSRGDIWAAIFDSDNFGMDGDGICFEILIG